MTFITGISIGLFIGGWVGVLTMCLCRVSTRSKNVIGGRRPYPEAANNDISE